MYEFKTLTIGGQTFEIAGLPWDPYFTQLGLAVSANVAFCNLVWTSIQPGSVALDIGANIGLTTVLLNKVVPDVAVYSFEPGPKAYGCLLKTLDRNNMPTHRSYRVGLGARQGLCNFHESDLLLAGSHVVRDGGKSDLDVEIRLSTIDAEVERLALDRLDFIKIDVEGYELEVLDGATETLARFRPRVFLEFNSYCLIALADMNPRDALRKIHSTFKSVAWWHEGSWRQMVSEIDCKGFIHDNLVKHACVDDLLCS